MTGEYLNKHRKSALFYTIATIVGLAVGAYFSPIASIFGGFAGLYVVAVLEGKIGMSSGRLPHQTGIKSLDINNEIDDLTRGNGLPGSGHDPHL